MLICFNDTATTEIYTLSLHDALPICQPAGRPRGARERVGNDPGPGAPADRRVRGQAPPPNHGVRRRPALAARSEEHTSELQSRQYLVCRLLLEKNIRSYCGSREHVSP